MSGHPVYSKLPEAKRDLEGKVCPALCTTTTANPSPSIFRSLEMVPRDLGDVFRAFPLTQYCPYSHHSEHGSGIAGTGEYGLVRDLPGHDDHYNSFDMHRDFGT